MTLIKYAQGHEHEQNAVVKMVVPGRRALGEQWREITIRPDPVTGDMTVENEEAEAPAEGRPVIVPAMANLSDQEINHILEGALKAQDYYSRRQRKPSQAEIAHEVNQMWLDYCENKLKWLKGETTLGPAGFHQREAPRSKL